MCIKCGNDIFCYCGQHNEKTEQNSKLNDRVILQADIAYHSHPYATCPYCGEEEEVAGDDCGTECSFCHKTYKYSLEI